MHQTKVNIRDERNQGWPIPARSLGELLPDQQSTSNVVADYDTGILSAATALARL